MIYYDFGDYRSFYEIHLFFYCCAWELKFTSILIVRIYFYLTHDLLTHPIIPPPIRRQIKHLISVWCPDRGCCVCVCPDWKAACVRGGRDQVGLLCVLVAGALCPQPGVQPKGYTSFQYFPIGALVPPIKDKTITSHEIYY